MTETPIDLDAVFPPDDPDRYWLGMAHLFGAQYLCVGIDKYPREWKWKMPFAMPTRCFRGRTWPDPETGEMRSEMCKAVSLCWHCAKVRRTKIKGAVGASDPKFLLTLTLASGDWSTTQQMMTMLRKLLLRSGYEFEWAWKVECNTGRNAQGSHDHHVHAYVHGMVPQQRALLSAFASRAGFGPIVDLKLLADHPEKAPEYVWGAKKIHEVLPVNHEHHLAVNGGHVYHATHGFWRYEGTRMPLGKVLQKVRKARWQEANRPVFDVPEIPKKGG